MPAPTPERVTVVERPYVPVPTVVVNPERIPATPEENVFTLINDEGTPLGNIRIMDKDTFEFLDEEAVPKGKVEIKEDGTIEILDEEIPLAKATLPKTGSVGGLLTTGIVLIAAGMYLTKKEDEK